MAVKKGKYKYPRCPVCGYRTSINTAPNDRQKEMIHHLTCKAKNELWAKEFYKKLETPHLDYFRKKKRVKNVEVKYKLHFNFNE